MKTTFLRFFFAASLVMIALVVLNSYALAEGIYAANMGGNDLSYPQCGVGGYPQNAFDVVGVSGGRAFTGNPCLAQEFAEAKTLADPTSLYMNLNAPIGPTADKGMSGPYGNCTRKEVVCQAENYGYNAARYAMRYAATRGASAPMWWLDVEVANSWSADPSLNQATINGAVRFFAMRGIPVGVYSTPYMWSTITGDYKDGLPVWFATVSMTPAAYCSPAAGFTGGVVDMVQYYPSSGVDADYVC